MASIVRLAATVPSPSVFMFLRTYIVQTLPKELVRVAPPLVLTKS